MHFLYLISFLGSVTFAASTVIQPVDTNMNANQPTSIATSPKKAEKTHNKSAAQALTPPRFKNLKRNLPRVSSKRILADKHQVVEESESSEEYQEGPKTGAISPEKDQKTFIESYQESEDGVDSKIIQYQNTVDVLENDESLNEEITIQNSDIQSGDDHEELETNDVDNKPPNTAPESNSAPLLKIKNVKSFIKRPKIAKIDSSSNHTTSPRTDTEDFDPEIQEILSEGAQGTEEIIVNEPEVEISENEYEEAEIEMNEFRETKPIKLSETSAFTLVPISKLKSRKVIFKADEVVSVKAEVTEVEHSEIPADVEVELDLTGKTETTEVEKSDVKEVEDAEEAAEVEGTEVVNNENCNETGESIQEESAQEEEEQEEEDANTEPEDPQCTISSPIGEPVDISDSKPKDSSFNYFTFDFTKWYAVQYVAMALFSVLVAGYVVVKTFPTKKKLRKSALDYY